MPDLAYLISSLGDVGATIFQATVTTVGTGVATVEINGGTFLDVPYMQSNYGAGGAQPYPSVNQKVYVIAQLNWGMLIIGAPAPGPTRSVSSGSSVLWPPSAIATYFTAGGSWVVPGTNDMAATIGTWATEIFSVTSRPALPSSGLSGAGFALNVLSADSGGFLGGGAYLTAGLFSNATPTGVLATIPGTTEQTYFLNVNEPAYLPIPMDWANRLIAGTAKGIYVRASGEYDTVHVSLAELQLTFL